MKLFRLSLQRLSHSDGKGGMAVFLQEEGGRERVQLTAEQVDQLLEAKTKSGETIGDALSRVVQGFVSE